jgi:DNA replication protein DnaC
MRRSSLDRLSSRRTRCRKRWCWLLTTNKPFAEWPTTFPNAACVVTLVDRLMHRAEIVTIDGDSYRLREAEERQRERASARKRKKEAPKV